MGVLELCDDLDLAREAIWAQRRCELRAEDLDRDLAIMFEISGEIDSGHATGPGFTLNVILSRERFSQAFDVVGLEGHGCQGRTCGMIPAARVLSAPALH